MIHTPISFFIQKTKSCDISKLGQQGRLGFSLANDSHNRSEVLVYYTTYVNKIILKCFEIITKFSTKTKFEKKKFPNI